MVMKVSRRLSIDWGHLLTVLSIAAWVLWYLADLRSVSLDLENTLLVQPVGILLLVLIIAVLPQCFHSEELPESLKPEVMDAHSIGKVLLLMLAFVGLVCCMFWIGFDIAVLLFCALGLAICGERRWWVMLVFSTLCSVIMVKGYQILAPFPMPNLILG
jgi:magnesium-transporting ATPase (P-type)